MEKVVKCTNSKCGQYFMLTEKVTKCPFCKTEYVEVEVRPESDSDSGSEKKPKEKKETTKTRKKIFKIWNDN